MSCVFDSNTCCRATRCTRSCSPVRNMATYQGSDWFKSGAHVRVNPAESKQQLLHQASQQLADYSRKLQIAYDGGLALFKNNFSGTDAQVAILPWRVGIHSEMHNVHGCSSVFAGRFKRLSKPCQPYLLSARVCRTCTSDSLQV